MAWFWYFAVYSFLGFLLEVGYARLTHSLKPDRKCFLLLPLCPVYGLGALAILTAAQFLYDKPLLMALIGGGAATAAEYAMDLFYEKLLGVSFWDYSDLPLNIHGRVCLPFSLAWSVLSLGLVYLLHPFVAEWSAQIPPGLFPPAAILLSADAVISAWLLRTTGTTDSLKWYDGGKRFSG